MMDKIILKGINAHRDAASSLWPPSYSNGVPFEQSVRMVLAAYRRAAPQRMPWRTDLTGLG